MPSPMPRAELLAHQYHEADIDLPKAAAARLDVWETVKQAAVDPGGTSLATDVETLTPDNVSERLAAAAIARTIKAEGIAIRNELDHHLAELVLADLAADAERRHKKLKPKFLKAATVIVDALDHLTPDELDDPDDLLTLTVDPDTDPDEFARRTHLAALVHRATRALDDLTRYAPLLSDHRATPAPFVTLDPDTTPATWQAACEAWTADLRPWLRLYALDGITPACNTPDETGAVLTQVEQLNSQQRAEQAEAEREQRLAETADRRRIEEAVARIGR